MLIEEEKVEIVEDETTTSTNEKKKSAKKGKSAAKKTTTKVDIKERVVRITIPEELDYTEIFDDIFAYYTTKNEVVKVKTINMGSMFKVYYQVTLKDEKNEKKFVDEIRTRNGNLEVSIQRVDYNKSEL